MMGKGKAPIKRVPTCTINSVALAVLTATGQMLRQNAVSVELFAKQVVHPSQGTLSSLLNKPPKGIPAGARCEPWVRMVKFLTSPEEQEKVLPVT